MQQSINVILVDENDRPLGTMEKMEVHQKALLHRAFSIFIFNSNNEMLLQQRAKNKYHSAGLWTNACCSHPAPGSTTLLAARQRLREEMGFDTILQKAFDFIYEAPFDNGLTEHEFDHVYIGRYDGVVSPDEAEVSAFCFKSLTEIERDLRLFPEKYTAWFKIAFPRVEDYFNTLPIATFEP